VQFVVVGFGFEVGDDVLPVRGQDVFVGTVKTLVDLLSSALFPAEINGNKNRTFAQAPV
jgi:hypothetical protein